MSSLRKKGLGDIRQGSPNQLMTADRNDCLLHSDLPIMELKFARSGVRDFKKQNQSSPMQ